MAFPELIRAECLWCGEISHHCKKYNDEWYCPSCYERVKEKEITTPARKERFQTETLDFMDKVGFEKSI